MTTTATRERPILFSAPMVKAILDGRKTQTRRVVSHSNSTSLGYTEKWAWDQLVWNGMEYKDRGPHLFAGNYEYLHVCAWNGDDGPPPKRLLKSKTIGEWFDRDGVSYRVRPRLKPGDHLWVRETWAPCIGGPCEPGNPVLYKADSDATYGLTWKPSIHMPRWASRITLEITEVRVERLMDISEQDAIAEGCKPVMGTGWDKKPCVMLTARDEFEVLWNKINGPVAYYRNPWVWAVTFKRLTQDLR